MHLSNMMAVVVMAMMMVVAAPVMVMMMAPVTITTTTTTTNSRKSIISSKISQVIHGVARARTSISGRTLLLRTIIVVISVIIGRLSTSLANPLLL